jgi:hypothetical protein
MSEVLIRVENGPPLPWPQAVVRLMTLIGDMEQVPNTRLVVHIGVEAVEWSEQ